MVGHEKDRPSDPSAANPATPHAGNSVIDKPSEFDEMPPQRSGTIGRPDDAARLERGHELLADVADVPGRERSPDEEAVSTDKLHDVFHLGGDLVRGAHQG